MLILIAPKFHLRYSRPRVADTDSATIPTSPPPPPLSSLLLHYLCRHYRRYCYSRCYYSLYLQQIAIAACRYATIAHYLYGCYCGCRGAVHYILAAARCITATANAAVHAAVAYRHCSRYCRCREYNRCYRHRRYYSNTIVTDVIANAIAAVISTAVAAVVTAKF